MTRSSEHARWATTRAFFADGFQVAWAYPGHPRETHERRALAEMLERHGTGARAWLLIPEIRVTHTEITPDPYHDGQLMLSHGCAWAVYGILREKPSVGWIPEGVQIPLYGEREYDRKPGSPPAA